MSRIEKIVMATGNKDKVEEAQTILGIPIEIADIKIDEIQSMDLEEVARKKVEAAYAVLKRPVIVDDVGVFVEVWDGFPGPLIKYLQRLGNERILEFMMNQKNRNVIVESAIGYHDGEISQVFIGSVKGSIATEERGTDGWGFDPIFIPDGQGLTYAEMGLGGKNQLSHRRLAFDKLRAHLDSQKG